MKNPTSMLSLKAFAALFSACLFVGISASASEARSAKDISYLSPEEAKDPYRQERCVLDIHVPAGAAQNLPVVVWFHGGGLTEGNKTWFPGELLQQGLLVVTPNYRLIPRGTPVNALEDAAAAVAWVFAHIQEYGGDPSRIFLSGHSAGGYLSTLLTLDRSWLAAHQIDANRIVGLVPFSAQMVTHSSFRSASGSAELESFAPLAHARADAPPLLLLMGDRDKDLPGRYSQNTEMLTRLKAAGHKDCQFVEFRGTDHVTMQPTGIPLLVTEIARLSAARPPATKP
ncbi:MAG: alpha/beta hydrolase [Opitutus sp.]|nr:alpha/beta hydrolase [Opitutus sp.]MCS6246561.1 alpha/beta hydrolase [Opitutus sp.]MCS6272754.1 alpha/beta hydrolase [Opitutus sp.]MCS6276386.1 alpha/beta hydrolase [Opitutus sp.]MCS6301966.1 alpha/beta hydrolase [Opitutus sp.]